MGEGADRVVIDNKLQREKRMVVAVNDISFMWGFNTPYDARNALIRFGNVALGLKDERVSKVNIEMDIINSHKVRKDTLLAPDYPLIRALLEIREENKEQFLLLLQILTQCGEEEEPCEDEFVIGTYASQHCARYRNQFVISFASDDIFENDMIEGCLNQTELCQIRNLSNEDHKYTYWDELGFREYELNRKHGNREYYRCGGKKVGIAPETDELGQQLLNHAIEIKGKLFSVDHDRDNRIFEFRHSHANMFHGFLQEDISADLKKKILKVDNRVLSYSKG